VIQNKLLLLDCDSTLSAIEGIDELARLRGASTFAAVESMTRAASKMVTMNFLNAATPALANDFAPTKSEYGSMVDILGVGTLVRGSSGIGKSECVLGLLERRHSLVSDDITRYRSIEGR